MKRAAFLFGSGISFGSGAPTVGKITEALLDGAWKPHTDSSFLPCTANDGRESLDVAKRAQDFIRILKQQIDPHLLARERREAHYEDIYSAVLQILQDETLEIVNPLIARSLELVKAATAHLWVRYGYDYKRIDDNRFASLADRCVDLIQWVVYYSLTEARTPQGIELISEVARNVGELDIFTLNHDLLVESQLEKDGVSYSDGFGDKRGDVFQFGGSWKNTDRVRLFKLHGSLDWFLFRSKSESVDFYAKVDGDMNHCKDSDGKFLSLLDAKPMFLTGTSVKEQSYGTGLFGDIFIELRARLSRHRTLVCCGYGWADKGINTRVRQWLRDSKESRVIILHNDPADVLPEKPAWWAWWDRFEEAGKVEIVPKWLNECTVGDFEPYFDD